MNKYGWRVVCGLCILGFIVVGALIYVGMDGSEHYKLDLYLEGAFVGTEDIYFKPGYDESNIQIKEDWSSAPGFVRMYHDWKVLLVVAGGVFFLGIGVAYAAEQERE